MQTDCSADLFGFAPVERRAVVAAFDGGAITSDAGALLLGATDRAIGLVERFAACFRDGRRPELIEHEVRTLVGQRVFGIALGYEDRNDHDLLRHDPVMALLAGKLRARRRDCAPVAGKSTLNRLELSRPAPTRYHRIGHDPEAIAVELAWAEEEAGRSGKPARRYKEFRWSTLNSWSRRRRVVAKAEWLADKATPRFVVTSLKAAEIGALVKTSVRRIKLAMASAYPWQQEWALAHARLTSAAA